VTSVSLKTTTGNVIACGLVILAAVRAALLFIRYETGVPTVSRYHVESAALVLVVIGAIVRLLRQVDHANPASHVSSGSLAEWLVWIGLALALYWPAQTVVFLGSVAARMHLRPWTDAASLRDAVLHAAAANGRLRQSGDPVLADLPDSVSGAYVFRNGAREAFASGVGLRITAVTSVTTGPCSFRWDEARLSFVPE
jgi:hypothetical protein